MSRSVHNMLTKFLILRCVVIEKMMSHPKLVLSSLNNELQKHCVVHQNHILLLLLLINIYKQIKGINNA